VKLRSESASHSRRGTPASRRFQGPTLPKFAADLTMLFDEVPVLDRFERAAKAGFDTVELQFRMTCRLHRTAQALSILDEWRGCG
jgi:hypothetical protein